MHWIQFDADRAGLIEAVQREYVDDLKQAGFCQPIEGWVERFAPRGKRERNVAAGFVQYLAERDVPFMVL